MSSSDSEFPSTFKSHLIDIQAPPNDPTLSLKLHCLHFKPQSTTNSRPLLLIHGHPQNHLIWRHLAPKLSQQSSDRPWEIIVADLRGHGKSGAPPASVELGAPDEKVGQWRYSKREMGRDLFELMKHFGHESFDVLAHDRGARVAHRMALDRPKAIKSMILLDIAPTLDLYEKADSRFASIYWHWYFLIQPYPTPEHLILGSPQTYLEKMTTRFPSSNLDSANSIFSQSVFKSYLDQISNPSQVHATCSDYRSSAPNGPDLTLDKQDREKGNKILCKTKILWGKRGVNEVLFGNGTLDLWKDCCLRKEDCVGKALNGGHYLPEDSWEEILVEMENFF